VAGQFLLIGLVAFTPDHRRWPGALWLTLLGAVFVALGFGVLVRAFVHLGPALTANPVPKLGAPLQVNGIYARVRHPIYSGLLTASFGIAIWRASALSFLFLILLASLLNFKARWEEKFLSSTHEGYSVYMTKVPRFFPRFRKNRD